MANAKLRIQQQPSKEKLSQQFALIGAVDVDASDVLETLYVLPSKATAELNFAQVERVNSMGLAQLLKLFDHCQKQDITIRITCANQMVCLLFDKTGLAHFLADGYTAIPEVKKPEISVACQPQDQPEKPAAVALRIQPQPSAELLGQQFVLIGNIDVQAVQLLEPLYVLPQHGTVELNFAQVQRVNSMGLAQLLKLFEHWQKRQISIQVTNTNRMIGVLFKMTGLARFLSDAPAPVIQSQETVQTVPPAPQLLEMTRTVTPARTRTETPEHRSGFAVTAGRDKLKLWVSAQSSQQMNGWYFFNTYLQRHLGREVHLELVYGAMGEPHKKIEQMDIVFTNPFAATRLILEHNFQPLLRPMDQADEVTLLVRADDQRQNLAAFHGGKIVTAAPDSFVYLLGRFLLEEDEAALSDMEYLFSGHDIKALQMLLKGAADILFVLSDTYRSLSGLTRKNLREIDQSDTAFAFHLFSVAPHCIGLGTALSDVLLDMGLDSQGRQVLADLGIPGWIKPAQDECDMLAMLFNRYAVNSTSP